MEMRWARIEMGALAFTIHGWNRRKGVLNHGDSSEMGEAH